MLNFGKAYVCREIRIVYFFFSAHPRSCGAYAKGCNPTATPAAPADSSQRNSKKKTQQNRKQKRAQNTPHFTSLPQPRQKSYVPAAMRKTLKITIHFLDNASHRSSEGTIVPCKRTAPAVSMYLVSPREQGRTSARCSTP